MYPQAFATTFIRGHNAKTWGAPPINHQTKRLLFNSLKATRTICARGEISFFFQFLLIILYGTFLQEFTSSSIALTLATLHTWGVSMGNMYLIC